MTNWDRFWGGENGHAYVPMESLHKTRVEIMMNGYGETVTVYMASRNEWKDRISRVVSRHTGYSEDSFTITTWEVID